jgi:hypothetical protein
MKFRDVTELIAHKQMAPFRRVHQPEIDSQYIASRKLAAKAKSPEPFHPGLDVLAGKGRGDQIVLLNPGASGVVRRCRCHIRP